MISRPVGVPNKLFLVAIPLVLGLVAASALMVRHTHKSGPHAPFNEEGNSFVIDELFGYKNVIPLVIVGSGPAGLTAAIYARRGAIRTVVIQGNEPGGLLTKTTQVENWPGEPSILGPDLIARMRQQAEQFGAQFLSDAVAAVDFSRWPYSITTEEGNELHALAVVIATGARPRLLEVPGEQEYWGRGITTCAVCDAPFYKDKDVVVVGGGDSAAEEALQLVPYARSITVLVRRDSMRAAASMQKRLKQHESISIRYNTSIKKIMGDDKAVTGIELIDHASGAEELFPAKGVFIAIGHLPNSALFSPYLATDELGYLTVEGRTQATSLPGIFAAGEVEDRIYKQAIVSAGHGSSAALDALAFLRDIGFTQEIDARLVENTALTPKNKLERHQELEELASPEQLTTLAQQHPDKAVLLDFYTDTCVMCTYLMPVVTWAAQQISDRVLFYKVNAENPLFYDFLKAYGVDGVPMLILLKGERVIARSSRGVAYGRKELMELIETALA